MRYSVIILITLLIACSLSPRVEHGSELPNVSQLGCCWQATESLKISFQEREFNTLTVTAVTHDGLTLVMLDPLHQRLLTITQRGQEVMVDLALDAGRDLPVKLLLLGIYLRNLNANDWVFTNWQVEKNGNVKTLSKSGKATIRLTEGIFSNGNVTDLYYPGLKMRVLVKTLSRESL